MNARARNVVGAWSGSLGTLRGTHALVETRAAADSAEGHCGALGGLRHVP